MNYRSNKNRPQNKGMTLVEVMVATSLSLLLLLGLSQTTLYNIKGAKSFSISQDAVRLYNQIHNLVDNQNFCTKIFKGQTFDPTLPSAQSIFIPALPPHSSIKYEPGYQLPNRDLQIKELSLSLNNLGSTYASTQSVIVNLNLVLDNLAVQQNRGLGTKEISKVYTFGLDVDTATRKILRCAFPSNGIPPGIAQNSCMMNQTQCLPGYLVAGENTNLHGDNLHEWKQCNKPDPIQLVTNGYVIGGVFAVSIGAFLMYSGFLEWIGLPCGLGITYYVTYAEPREHTYTCCPLGS